MKEDSCGKDYHLFLCQHSINWLALAQSSLYNFIENLQQSSWFEGLTRKGGGTIIKSDFSVHGEMENGFDLKKNVDLSLPQAFVMHIL